jgi:hypothetical protein
MEMSRRLGWLVAIVGLPLLLFHWTLPFVGARMIGNDYPRYPIQYQQELFLALHGGTWPLFVPGFAGGQSAAALTLGQLYHPIAHLAAVMPGYWAGHALDWLTTWRLVSMAATHGAVFGLLRRLGQPPGLAFLLGMAGVYNLRALDCFRYGAALEAWTGMWFLWVALGIHAAAPTPRCGPLAIMAATYWLVTSGHPQMMYYAALGAAGFAIAWPFLLPALGGRALEARVRRRFWISSAVAIAVGIAGAAAYVLPYYWDFVRTNAGRVGQDYAWAAGYTDTVGGALASFFRPLGADVHGAFGGSYLLTLGACLPLAWLVGARPPRVVWACWLVALLVFLHALGDRTPVHWLAWRFLPLASSFRIAGRITLLLPLLLLVPAAWAARAAPLSWRVGARTVTVHPFGALAGMALVIVGAAWTAAEVPDASLGLTPPLLLRHPPPAVEQLALWLGLAALVGCVLREAHARAAGPAIGAAALTTAGSLALLLAWATWTQARVPTPTWDALRTHKRQLFGYPHREGLGLYHRAVQAALDHGMLEPFLGRVAVRAEPVGSLEVAFARLRADLDPDAVIVEADPTTVAAAGPRSSDLTGAQVRLAAVTHNHLDLEVGAPAAAWLVVGVPFSGHWWAWRNGVPTRLARANGNAHALPIPAGRSRVILRYWSHAAALGMLVTCVTLAGVGCWLAGPGRVAARVSLLLGAAGLFGAWWAATLGGADLGTVYAWDAPAAPRPANIAYAKRSILSSEYPAQEPHRAHASLATDGAAFVAAMTGPERMPWLVIDLAATRQLAAIVWHEPAGRPGVNVRPLRVAISDDGTRWHEVAQTSVPATSAPLRIDLPAGSTGRYVRVQASGPSLLACREIEAR